MLSYRVEKIFDDGINVAKDYDVFKFIDAIVSNFKTDVDITIWMRSQRGNGKHYLCYYESII